LPPIEFRRPPKAIKGLLAQAAAANTPWRRNIRLDNAKLHLRSLKSIGQNLIFWIPSCRKQFWGKSLHSCGFAMERRTGSNGIVTGKRTDFQQQIAILGKTSVIVCVRECDTICTLSAIPPSEQ